MDYFFRMEAIENKDSRIQSIGYHVLSWKKMTGFQPGGSRERGFF
jgi:hypothetical protein